MAILFFTLRIVFHDASFHIGTYASSNAGCFDRTRLQGHVSHEKIRIC